MHNCHVSSSLRQSKAEVIYEMKFSESYRTNEYTSLSLPEGLEHLYPVLVGHGPVQLEHVQLDWD